MTRILAIETSCDETAAVVVKSDRNKIIVEAALFSSQIPLHRITKGVVPEVAARAHTEMIIPTIEAVMKKAKVRPNDINAIAVTSGPGLFTSLMVGVETAKFLAKIWNKLLIAVNHLEGHIYANFINQPNNLKPKTYNLFPAVCLIASGGHTMLVLMKKHLDYKILGTTLDDAAGETFDKTASLLGLPYPGGPEIARLAKFGNPNAIKLPRPLINRDDFNFSFAGLKTAVLYGLEKCQISYSSSEPRTRCGGSREAKSVHTSRQARSIIASQADWAASIQQAIVDVLVTKTIRAAKKFQVKTVLLGGGVAANHHLRQTLEKNLRQECPRVNFIKPETAYTTDNAAMIGAAGIFRLRAGQIIDPSRLTADPNLSLT